MNQNKPKQPIITIPKFTDVAAVAKTEQTEIEDSVQLAEELVIRNNAELETAAKWIAAVKTSKKEIDTKRKGFVKPLQDVVKDLNDFFRPAITALDRIEADLKEKVAGYITRSLEQRDTLLKSVSRESEPEAKQAIISKASELEPKSIAGVSIREEWSGHVEDSGELIAWAIENRRFEVLQPNEAVLKTLTKTRKEDPQIPGWSANVLRKVAVNPSRIK